MLTKAAFIRSKIQYCYDKSLTFKVTIFFLNIYIYLNPPIMAKLNFQLT